MFSLLERTWVLKGLFPAIVLFAAAAAGLLALRENMTGGMTAQPALAAAAEPTSGRPEVTSGEIRTASLRKHGDGHYWASARVNGMVTTFLVDTGATLVALTPQDARRVGLNPDTLPKTVDVRTAAGNVKAASAQINELEIDGVVVKDVAAVVIPDGLEHSLLGMSYLNRLGGWDVTPMAIIIRR